MTLGALSAFALGVLIWFGFAFGTRSWTLQWIAALVAGLAMAWWRFGTMQDAAATLGIAPMSFFKFAAIAVGGMLLVASAGMGLYRLLQSSRRSS